MTVQLPTPSKTLLRAATRERDELLAHVERLDARRRQLLDEAHELADGISKLQERLDALSVMVPVDDQPLAPSDRATAAAEAVANVAGSRLISGPAVREAAIRTLLNQPERTEAVHYRSWYELVVEAGFEVRGKDPLAVFLTQLNRSPVVRKSSQSGVYELDRKAPLRLRQRLERLHAEMRELSVAGVDVAKLDDAPARRRRLAAQIGKTERALSEALRVLRRDDDFHGRQQAIPRPSRLSA